MKVFISYNKSDVKYKDRLIRLLDDANILYYCVPEDMDYNSQEFEAYRKAFVKELGYCDVVICLIGKDTYSKTHVDFELNEALKGGPSSRKGIVALMLDSRKDNKENIDYRTFPVRLVDNIRNSYVVIENFDSFHLTAEEVLEKARIQSLISFIPVFNARMVLPFRLKEYYAN